MDQWQYLVGLGAVAVIAMEMLVLRTGVFGKAEYWMAMGMDDGQQVFLFGAVTVTAGLLLWGTQRRRCVERGDRPW